MLNGERTSPRSAVSVAPSVVGIALKTTKVAEVVFALTRLHTKGCVADGLFSTVPRHMIEPVVKVCGKVTVTVFPVPGISARPRCTLHAARMGVIGKRKLGCSRTNCTTHTDTRRCASGWSRHCDGQRSYSRSLVGCRSGD